MTMAVSSGGARSDSARAEDRGAERAQRMLLLSGIVLFVAGFAVVAGLPDLGPLGGPAGADDDTATPTAVSTEETPPPTDPPTTTEEETTTEDDSLFGGTETTTDDDA